MRKKVYFFKGVVFFLTISPTDVAKVQSGDFMKRNRYLGKKEGPSVTCTRDGRNPKHDYRLKIITIYQ